jgi:O-antigen/teichoic acid export membrane protein
VLLVIVYLAAAMVTGLLSVGGDVLLLMAGPSKAQSAPVFQLIGVNYVLDGVGGIVTAGLLLHKRTMTILMLSVLALIVNVVLNLFWIPRFGVIGAVYATFVSFMALHIVKYLFCPRDLRALPGWRETTTAVALSAFSLAIWYYTDLFGIVSHSGRFATMAGLMIFTFALPALALDSRLRNAILGYVRKRND